MFYTQLFAHYSRISNRSSQLVRGSAKKDDLEASQNLLSQIIKVDNFPFEIVAEYGHTEGTHGLSQRQQARTTLAKRRHEHIPLPCG